ncbi:unnamed protein product [Caenorhabditis auriculariae]|uniref:Uncharacterized protein n=1 Tax=Caenorhabditis auriculariae TaxID=2777116 RepID=A0A8S1HPG0_9PELO|nr:unnamed protein product [Caenorhabditis auriculariae]
MKGLIDLGGTRTYDLADAIPFFFILLCTACMCAVYTNSIVFHSTINFLHAFENASSSDCTVYFTPLNYEEVDVRMNASTLQSYNVVTRKVYYLSNPQKESLITVTSIGTAVAAAPIAYAYNHMGFR